MIWTRADYSYSHVVQGESGEWFSAAVKRSTVPAQIQFKRATSYSTWGADVDAPPVATIDGESVICHVMEVPKTGEIMVIGHSTTEIKIWLSPDGFNWQQVAPPLV